MPTRQVFANRRLSIVYWDSEHKFSHAEKIHLEQSLKKIADVSYSHIGSLQDHNLIHGDLLVVAAHKLQSGQFEPWLDRIVGEMKKPETIWTPALIVAPVNFDESAAVLHKYVKENWYFDVVHPNHFDSIPLRMTNLMRIHDHLKELLRYDQELFRVSAEVKQLELRLETLGAK